MKKIEKRCALRYFNSSELWPPLSAILGFLQAKRFTVIKTRSYHTSINPDENRLIALDFTYAYRGNIFVYREKRPQATHSVAVMKSLYVPAPSRVTVSVVKQLVKVSPSKTDRDQTKKEAKIYCPISWLGSLMARKGRKLDELAHWHDETVQLNLWCEKTSSQCWIKTFLKPAGARDVWGLQ